MEKDSVDCGSMRDRAERRRRQIIAVARKLFVERGFHATGVAQITRESGIAVGQLYRDFAAKEDIVAAIVEGDCARFVASEALRRAIEAEDTDAVWTWLREFLEPADYDRGTSAMFAEIAAESARNVRIAAIFARSRGEADANMKAALELLAPGAHLTERRALLADLMFTQSLGLKQHRLLRPELDITPMVDMVLGFVGTEIERMRAHPGKPVQGPSA